LYEDDGETTDYLNGEFAVTRFALEGNTFAIHPVEGDVSLVPPSRTYRILLRGVDEKTTASLHGHYDATMRTLTLEPMELRSGDNLTITMTT
jgi:hypothetical protein